MYLEPESEPEAQSFSVPEINTYSLENTDFKFLKCDYDALINDVITETKNGNNLINYEWYIYKKFNRVNTNQIYTTTDEDKIEILNYILIGDYYRIFNVFLPNTDTLNHLSPNFENLPEYTNNDEIIKIYPEDNTVITLDSGIAVYYYNKKFYDEMIDLRIFLYKSVVVKNEIINSDMESITTNYYSSSDYENLIEQKNNLIPGLSYNIINVAGNTNMYKYIRCDYDYLFDTLENMDGSFLNDAWFVYYKAIEDENGNFFTDKLNKKEIKRRLKKLLNEEYYGLFNLFYPIRIDGSEVRSDVNSYKNNKSFVTSVDYLNSEFIINYLNNAEDLSELNPIYRDIIFNQMQQLRFLLLKTILTGYKDSLTDSEALNNLITATDKTSIDYYLPSIHYKRKIKETVKSEWDGRTIYVRSPEIFLSNENPNNDYYINNDSVIPRDMRFTFHTKHNPIDNTDSVINPIPEDNFTGGSEWHSINEIGSQVSYPIGLEFMREMIEGDITLYTDITYEFRRTSIYNRDTEDWEPDYSMPFYISDNFNKPLGYNLDAPYDSNTVLDLEVVWGANYKNNVRPSTVNSYRYPNFNSDSDPSAGHLDVDRLVNITYKNNSERHPLKSSNDNLTWGITGNEFLRLKFNNDNVNEWHAINQPNGNSISSRQYKQACRMWGYITHTPAADTNIWNDYSAENFGLEKPRCFINLRNINHNKFVPPPTMNYRNSIKLEIEDATPGGGAGRWLPKDWEVKTGRTSDMFYNSGGQEIVENDEGIYTLSNTGSYLGDYYEVYDDELYNGLPRNNDKNFTERVTTMSELENWVEDNGEPFSPINGIDRPCDLNEWSIEIDPNSETGYSYMWHGDASGTETEYTGLDVNGITRTWHKNTKSDFRPISSNYNYIDRSELESTHGTYYFVKKISMKDNRSSPKHSDNILIPKEVDGKNLLVRKGSLFTIDELNEIKVEYEDKYGIDINDGWNKLKIEFNEDINPEDKLSRGTYESIFNFDSSMSKLHSENHCIAVPNFTTKEMLKDNGDSSEYHLAGRKGFINNASDLPNSWEENLETEAPEQTGIWNKLECVNNWLCGIRVMNDRPLRNGRITSMEGTFNANDIIEKSKRGQHALDNTQFGRLRDIEHIGEEEKTYAYVRRVPKISNNKNSIFNAKGGERPVPYFDNVTGWLECRGINTNGNQNPEFQDGYKYYVDKFGSQTSCSKLLGVRCDLEYPPEFSTDINTVDFSAGKKDWGGQFLSNKGIWHADSIRGSEHKLNTDLNENLRNEIPTISLFNNFNKNSKPYSLETREIENWEQVIYSGENLEITDDRVEYSGEESVSGAAYFENSGDKPLTEDNIDQSPNNFNSGGNYNKGRMSMTSMTLYKRFNYKWVYNINKTFDVEDMITGEEPYNNDYHDINKISDYKEMRVQAQIASHRYSYTTFQNENNILEFNPLSPKVLPTSLETRPLDKMWETATKHIWVTDTDNQFIDPDEDFSPEPIMWKFYWGTNEGPGEVEITELIFNKNYKYMFHRTPWTEENSTTQRHKKYSVRFNLMLTDIESADFIGQTENPEEEILKLLTNDGEFDILEEGIINPKILQKQGMISGYYIKYNWGKIRWLDSQYYTDEFIQNDSGIHPFPHGDFPFNGIDSGERIEISFSDHEIDISSKINFFTTWFHLRRGHSYVNVPGILMEREEDLENYYDVTNSRLIFFGGGGHEYLKELSYTYGQIKCVTDTHFKNNPPEDWPENGNSGVDDLFNEEDTLVSNGQGELGTRNDVNNPNIIIYKGYRRRFSDIIDIALENDFASLYGENSNRNIFNPNAPWAIYNSYSQKEADELKQEPFSEKLSKILINGEKLEDKMTINTIENQSDTAFIFQNYLFDIQTQLCKWDGDLDLYSSPEILSNVWNSNIINFHSIEKYNGYFDIRSILNKTINNFGSKITRDSTTQAIDMKHCRALIDYPYPWSSLRSGRKILDKQREPSYTLDLPNYFRNYGDSDINKINHTSKKVINTRQVDCQRELFRFEIESLSFSEFNIPNRTIDYYLTKIDLVDEHTNELFFPLRGCSLEQNNKFITFYGSQVFKLFKFYDRFSMLDSGKRIVEEQVTKRQDFITENLDYNRNIEDNVNVGPLDIIAEDGRVYGPLGENPLTNEKTDNGIKENSMRLWQGYPGALRAKNTDRVTLKAGWDNILVDKLEAMPPGMGPDCTPFQGLRSNTNENPHVNSITWGSYDAEIIEGSDGHIIASLVISNETRGTLRFTHGVPEHPDYVSYDVKLDELSVLGRNEETIPGTRRNYHSYDKYNFNCYCVKRVSDFFNPLN